MPSKWQRLRRGFALEVLQGLALAPKVLAKGDSEQYVRVISAELDDGLLLEHIRIDFRLTTTQPHVEWNPEERWEVLCSSGYVQLGDVSSSDETPIFTFTFDQPSFARNLPHLRQLVHDLAEAPPGVEVDSRKPSLA